VFTLHCNYINNLHIHFDYLKILFFFLFWNSFLDIILILIRTNCSLKNGGEGCNLINKLFSKTIQLCSNYLIVFMTVL